MRHATLSLDKVVGGGQTIGTLADGRKALVWGGLPGEEVEIQITKKKSRFVEGVVAQVLAASDERIEPLDPTSYLSTSPWQIMDFAAEQHYKAALIEEAFELHDIVLPNPIEVYTDGQTVHYRNKVEFSWFGDTGEQGDILNLAFFHRGSKGKIVVDDCSLLPPPVMQLARIIRDSLQARGASARQLKTLLIRCDQQGNCAWQLYVKDPDFDFIDATTANALPALGGEIIYSDPKSPASRITRRLASFGAPVLNDSIFGNHFQYSPESFFQVNLPVYKEALKDMMDWITDGRLVDLYSGVGSIGLSITKGSVDLVEIDEHAVKEMRVNIASQQRSATARAILAPSEKALAYITSDAVIVVDPPRAGLHRDVIDRLLEVRPDCIIYLSCNPVTQARDIALLSCVYGIRYHRGYNFFPRTPHIEHLIILYKKH